MFSYKDKIHFDNRFKEENRKILEEARLENERIKKLKPKRAKSKKFGKKKINKMYRELKEREEWISKIV